MQLTEITSFTTMYSLPIMRMHPWSRACHSQPPPHGLHLRPHTPSPTAHSLTNTNSTVMSLSNRKEYPCKPPVNDSSDIKNTAQLITRVLAVRIQKSTELLKIFVFRNSENACVANFTVSV